jgi:hypothetical protein
VVLDQEKRKKENKGNVKMKKMKQAKHKETRVITSMRQPDRFYNMHRSNRVASTLSCKNSLGAEVSA